MFLLIFGLNFVGGIWQLLVRVNINDSGAKIEFPSFFQDTDAYPPKIFPLSFSYKHKVGPLLSHLLWKISLLEPSLVPLYNNSYFLHPVHSIILLINSFFWLDSFNIALLNTSVLNSCISLQALISLYTVPILIS